MTPSEIVSKMVSLHCAAELSRGGYAMRAGHEASQMLQDLLTQLIESGDLMAWATAKESEDMRNRLEVIS